MIRLSLEILRASWLNFLPNFVIHTGGRKKEHVLMGPPATWTIRWLRIPLKKALISWARWHFFIICSICFPMYRHYDMVLPFVLPTCMLTHHCVPCLCTTWQNLQIKIVCFFLEYCKACQYCPEWVDSYGMGEIAMPCYQMFLLWSKKWSFSTMV